MLRLEQNKCAQATMPPIIQSHISSYSHDVPPASSAPRAHLAHSRFPSSARCSVRSPSRLLAGLPAVARPAAS